VQGYWAQSEDCPHQNPCPRNGTQVSSTRYANIKPPWLCMCHVYFTPSRATYDLHCICKKSDVCFQSTLIWMAWFHSQLLALSNIVLIALIPKWIHKLIFATSEQLPVYRYEMPLVSSWFVTAHTVSDIFNRQTVMAVAAQTITPIFHPDNWCRCRLCSPLIDSRMDGSLIDDLDIEEPSFCRRGAEEMYDRRLHILLVNQRLNSTARLTRPFHSLRYLL